MTTINKFNLSKIYAIKSPHTDLYYIGSTTQPLYKRFNAHKIDYKKYLTETYHFVTSYKILEHDDAYIELLEEINCENRKQLEKREGEIIKEHKAQCVNKYVAGRSLKEWTRDNSDKIRDQRKQYYIDNTDKIKQYSIDNSDKKKQYQIDNTDKIKQYNKQYRIDNSEMLKEKRRIKYAETKLLKDLALITI